MGLVKRTHTGKIICFEQTPPNLNTVYWGEGGGGVQLTEVLKVLKQYIWPVAQEIIFFFFLRQSNPTGHRSMCMLPIFSLEYISMFNVYFHYDFPAS